MNLVEATTECQRWLDYLERQPVIVYDGARLAEAVKFLMTHAAGCASRGENCTEPYNWDDGVPYCDTCGIFRSDVARADRRKGR